MGKHCDLSSCYACMPGETVSPLQATFLKGKTGDAGNSALRAELEALDPDTLAIRCRRNGLSRAGDRDTQIQRLINLQVSDAPELRQLILSQVHGDAPHVCAGIIHAV